MAIALLVLCSKFQSPAQVLRALHSFTNSPDGSNPFASVVMSSNTLYGTTLFGGTNGMGILYSVGADGRNFSLLHTFGNADDGSYPYAGLLLVSNVLYGAASQGGDAGGGTIFSIGTDGTQFTVLHTFTNSPDGASPYGGLVLGGDTLYGTTYAGGNDSAGTIFSIGLNGENFTNLYSFTNAPDGTLPCLPEARLVLASNILYGVTTYGGTNQGGTIFSIGTDGNNFTVLHPLNGVTDGFQPIAELLLNSNTLYGTTSEGGSNQVGTIFSLDTSGSNFKVIYSFQGSADGSTPNGGVILYGGKLYGTAGAGGINGSGTLFSMNTDGSLFNVIYAFGADETDGVQPQSSLLSNGNILYGTTMSGGLAGNGTVFHIYLTVPTLTITSLGISNSIVLSWPSPSTGFSLEQNGDLRTANWLPVLLPVIDDGTNKNVTVGSPSGNLFFRLVAP
jgi:uncharacterized repeat protein (TIGR03803 family)